MDARGLWYRSKSSLQRNFNIKRSCSELGVTHLCLSCKPILYIHFTSEMTGVKERSDLKTGLFSSELANIGQHVYQGSWPKQMMCRLSLNTFQGSVKNESWGLSWVCLDEGKGSCCICPEGRPALFFLCSCCGLFCSLPPPEQSGCLQDAPLTGVCYPGL